MKGVVFTEFFEFVENEFDPVFLQEIINDSKVESEGVYTATGTYAFCEMGALVTTAASKSGLDISALMKAFGKHLFQYFASASPHHFVGVKTSFEFLDRVESHIHVDVKKLYPDAELPSFETVEHKADRFVMLYKSSRGLGDLCVGLIEGCMEHFGEKGQISKRDLEAEPETVIEFTIRMQSDG